MMRLFEKIIKALCKATLERELFFNPPRKIALISGAGIAGLAASFELLAGGFKVIIAEKRKDFNRFNVINLDVESQRFLKKFSLLNEFEKCIAAKISTHQYMLFEKNGTSNLGFSDVTALQPGNLCFEPEQFDELFNDDGIYSVRIKDLQNFLANKALEAGVRIFGNVEIEVLGRTQPGGIQEVQIKGKDCLNNSVQLQPDLIFVAEGAHSTTSKQFGMEAKEVKTECTGENWIFGNVKYSGSENFVVSLIDISENSLEIANIIFNARIGEINIAVTSKSHLTQALIQKRILSMVQKIHALGHIDEMPQSLIASVKHPVQVKNEKLNKYSVGNVFCIGDSAGHSSPLAGMGGTLGLTLIPRTVEQLLRDLNRQPNRLHHNFHTFTEAYTSRWIAKSKQVKKHCLGFFKAEERVSSDQGQTPSRGIESTLVSGSQ